MLVALLSLAVIFAILVISHLLWKAKIIKGEVSRKFVHILVGSFIAFWPFFMSFSTIQILSVLILAAVLFAKYFKLVPSIHAVKRDTWGDILFPVGIALTSILTDSQWIFFAAVLHISLADGFAAIIGAAFGRHRTYRLFGQTKTILGTMMFLVMSVAITFATVVRGPIIMDQNTLPLLLLLPVVATMIENASPYGSDNLFVPLIAVSFLEYSKLLSQVAAWIFL